MAHALGVDYSAFTANDPTNLTTSIFNFPTNTALDIDLTPIIESGFTRTRIAIGMNDYDGMQSDGEAPDIRLWAKNGEFVGIHSDHQGGEKIWIPDGSFVDIDVHHEHLNTKQSPYALFSGNDNAICIAYIEQIWPDGQDFAWVGNWGRTCEQEWYHSGMMVDGKALECTWLDGDGDKKTTGIQVYFPDFEDSTEGPNKDVDYLCSHGSSLGFRTEHDPTTVSYYIPYKRSSPTKRGSTLRPRAQNVPVLNSHRLVKSNLTTHDASSLCESKSSRGPDFVSLPEGKFCDMDTKTLWPICASTEEKDCFDNDAHGVRLVGPVGKRDELGTAWKNYTKVTHWE